MNKQDIFVSVIIPNYNHAQYLDERIQSVLNQTYQNFELIILDDVSTDNSLEVIEKYRNNPHVSHVIINKENSGSTFKQWYKGISVAKGELIWIAESDDSCALNQLEILVNNYLRTPQCAISACWSIHINQSGKVIGRKKCSKGYKMYESTDFIKKFMFAHSYIENAGQAIFPKRLFYEIDKSYMNFKACGDLLFWIEIARLGNVCFERRQLNLFRRYEGVVSDKKMRDGTSLKESKRIVDYLINNGYLKGFRLKVALGFYWDKIFLGHFNNESIRQELKRLWHTPKHWLCSYVIYARIYQFLRARFSSFYL